MATQADCRRGAAAQTEPARAPAACLAPVPRPPAGLRRFVATYHYVRERNSDGVTAITPADFAAQVRAIRDRYTIVTTEEFVARHRAADDSAADAAVDEPARRDSSACRDDPAAHDPDADRLALLTFDDGLHDQLRAAEILDRLGVPGVFYVPMRPYSREPDRWCPQHLLHALAERLGWTELERRAAPHLADVPIVAAAVDRLYHYEVPHKRRLKYALAFGVPAARAAEILHAINRDVGLSAEDWYLPPSALVALQNAGHALGGHGFDHVPYSTLPPKAQAADMHRAVATMNALGGALPRTIAYPFGRATSATEAIARGCGYTFGFTTANRIDARDVPAVLARRAPGD